MAQIKRELRLTRSNRLKLEKGRRYHCSISTGLKLLYRRTEDGHGTWTAKVRIPAGPNAGKYSLKVIGPADDYQEADGVTVFNLDQAQEKAREIVAQAKVDGGIIRTHTTVGDAAKKYLEWYATERKS